jgi:HEAT repeat protein
MLKRRIIKAVVLCLLLCSAEALAQGDAERVYQQGYAAVLDENWKAAKDAFELVVRAYSDSNAAEGARYWLCYVREKLGESPESIFQCNQDFVHSYPNSSWANDARSNMIRIGKQLARSGKPEYGEIVKGLQASQDEEVQLAALFALQDNHSDEAYQATVRLYGRSSSEMVRRKAVYILSTFHTPQVVSKLNEIAHRDPSEKARTDATYALAQIGGNQASAALLELSKQHGDPEVQRAASNSLARTDLSASALIQAARDESQPERAKDALIGLARVGGKEADETLANAARHARDPGIRQAAIEALTHRRDTVWVPVFRDVASSDNDPQVRKLALMALGQSRGSKEAWDALKDVLERRMDPSMRETALQAMIHLAQGGSFARSTREILLGIALDENEKRLTRTAVQGLTMVLSRKDAGPILAQVVLESKSHDAQKWALQMGANVEGGLTVQQLGEILKSESDPEMRTAAVVGLGNSNSDEAIPALFDAAKNDSDQCVRVHAVAALQRIGTPKAKEAMVQIAGGQR